MGHGFDDQGSKFDFSGNLNTLDVGDNLRHNRRLVVGEALGEQGGHCGGTRHRPRLNSYTADQRFFLAFARVWGSQYRPEALRRQLQTNPHPVSRFRANGTLMNIPEFHAAFSCKPGDAMVRPPEKQCKLW